MTKFFSLLSLSALLTCGAAPAFAQQSAQPVIEIPNGSRIDFGGSNIAFVDPEPKIETALAMVQPVQAPAAEPSLLAKLLAPLATPEGVVGIVMGALSVFGGASFLTDQRKRRVAKGVYYAFHIVEDLAAETDGTDILDKAVIGLSKLNEYMAANGWRPLKPGEEQLAKLGFAALHGEQVAEAKVQARAQALAADARVGVPQ